jgi:hypothetical protein
MPTVGDTVLASLRPGGRIIGHFESSLDSSGSCLHSNRGGYCYVYIDSLYHITGIITATSSTVYLPFYIALCTVSPPNLQVSLGIQILT